MKSIITFLLLSISLLFGQNYENKFQNIEVTEQFDIERLLSKSNFIQSWNKISEFEFSTHISRRVDASGNFMGNFVWTYRDSILQQILSEPYSFFSNVLNDENGDIIQIDQNLITNTGEIIQFLRTNYYYNSSKEYSERKVQRFSDSWVDERKTKYIYDSSNVLIEQIDSVFFNSTWTPYSKQVYTYDINNNNDRINRFRYNQQGEWEEYGRWINLYDPENKITLEIYQYKRDSLWVNSSRYRHLYNSEGIQMIEEYFNYNQTTSQWDLVYRDYSEYLTDEYLKLVSPNINTKIEPGDTLYINNMNLGVENINIDLSEDNGQTWLLVAENVSTDSLNYPIQMPSEENYQMKIRITSSSNTSLVSENELPFLLDYYVQHFDNLTHNTGNVEMSVFSNGVIGDDVNDLGVGFKFNDNESALFSGGVFFGAADLEFPYDTTITGMLPSLGIESLASYSNNNKLTDFTSDERFSQTSFCDFQSYIPPYSNLLIEQYSYSKDEDNHIYLKYIVNNPENGSEWKNFYIGVTADWDVGDAAQNFGGADAERKLLYQYEASQNNDANYYGIISLNNFFDGFVTSNAYTERLLLDVILSEDNYTDGEQSDQRSYIISGPYNLPGGENIEAVFAFVAGTDLDNLLENADLAIAGWDTTTVSVNDLKEMPNKFNLSQNYPNPFNPTTNIEYTLPTNSIVKIKVYDILGKEVKTLVNENKKPGSYSVEFDANNFSSGVYYYQLQAGDFIQTNKMLLIK